MSHESTDDTQYDEDCVSTARYSTDGELVYVEWKVSKHESSDAAPKSLEWLEDLVRGARDYYEIGENTYITDEHGSLEEWRDSLYQRDIAVRLPE